MIDSRGPNVYAVSRSVWDHTAFLDEPFTQREAWLWLIGAAAWKDIRTRGNAGAITLARGEFSFSVRFLAEKWKWSKSRVDRFLRTLENRDMVRDTNRDRCEVYFINNYNKFQIVGAPKRDSGGTHDGTRAGQQRDKEETVETVETKSSLRSDSRTSKKSTLSELDGFEEFWSEYPRKIAKRKAASAYRSALTRAPPADIAAGAKRYAAERAGEDETYTAHPTTWLNADRWNDPEKANQNGKRSLGTAERRPAINQHLAGIASLLDERGAFRR